MENTIKNIKKFENPFFWFATNGEVLAAEKGVPMDFSEYNWMKIWVDFMRDSGYDIDGWKLYCGSSTYIVCVDAETARIEKL